MNITLVVKIVVAVTLVLTGTSFASEKSVHKGRHVSDLEAPFFGRYMSPRFLKSQSTYCMKHDLADGLHPAGCNHFYFLCQAKKTKKISCPDNFYFDDAIKGCNERELVPACIL